MVVLLGILTVTRAGPDSGVARAAESLLAHLQLLFVPAGAGVVQYLSLIAAAALPLVAGLVVSWAAALLVTAAVASGCLSLTRRGAGPRS
jgi:holin-like protein